MEYIYFRCAFYWDGSSNLLIEICGGSDLGGYTDNGEVAITTGLAFNGSRTYRTDGFTEGGICGYSLTLENGTATSRPVIRLMGSEGDACTGTPDAGMATSSAESVCVDEILQFLFLLPLQPALLTSGKYLLMAFLGPESLELPLRCMVPHRQKQAGIIV